MVFVVFLAIILQHVVYQDNITNNNKCPSLMMSAQQATEVNNCQRNWSHLDTVSVGEIVSASCLSRYLSICLSINPTSILWYSFVIQMCSFTSYRFIFIYFVGRVLNDFVTFFVFFLYVTPQLIAAKAVSCATLYAKQLSAKIRKMSLLRLQFVHQPLCDKFPVYCPIS